MRYLKRVLLALLPAAVILLLWTQRYDVVDWFRLRGYEAPARIAALADQATMTETGRRLFYVNHPELNDKVAFNDNCTISEQSIVLGCYINNTGIFLFDVQDERLAGVHEVTAAHEMLHAAYDRLSWGDRRRINQLTAEVFASLQDDRIKASIEAYRQRDSSVVPNELHSILGTEVASLPSELEDYYSRYFRDRQAVVRFSKQYEAAFSERQAKVDAYDQQLADLRAQIDSLEASLNRQGNDLESERAHLDQLLAQQRYPEYNASVPGFNAHVRSYNSDVAKVRSLIEQFNQIVITRNTIAVEENELARAIDSRPETLPTE